MPRALKPKPRGVGTGVASVAMTAPIFKQKMMCLLHFHFLPDLMVIIEIKG